MANNHLPTHWPFDPRRLVTALIAARRSAGIDQGELARRLNVTRQQVSYLESGSSDLRTSTLTAWARALGLRLEVLPNEEPEGIVLGLDAHNAPVLVTLPELARHTMLLGAPGSGRSVAVCNLARSAIELGCSVLVVDLTANDQLFESLRAAAAEQSRAFAQLVAGHDPLTPLTAVEDLLQTLRRSAPAVVHLAAAPHTPAGPVLAARSFSGLLGFNHPCEHPVLVVVEGAHLAEPELLTDLTARGRAAGVSVVLSAPAPSAFPSETCAALARNTHVVLAMNQGELDASSLHALLADRLGRDPGVRPEELVQMGIGEVLVCTARPEPSLRWCRLSPR